MHLDIWEHQIYNYTFIIDTPFVAINYHNGFLSILRKSFLYHSIPEIVHIFKHYFFDFLRNPAKSKECRIIISPNFNKNYCNISRN